MERPELVVLREAGAGAGGIVYVVRDTKTGTLLARKVIARPAPPHSGGPLRTRSAECLSPHAHGDSTSFRRCGSADDLNTRSKAGMRDTEANGLGPAPANAPQGGEPSAMTESLCAARHEALVMQSCSHPNILRCLGVLVPTPHEASLLLEFMDAGSLDAAVARGAPVPPACIAYIAAGIVRGLHYLHTARGMLHRDLKPSNVLLGTAGDVKLCDFGEAVPLSRGRSLSVIGTAAYMAPERLRAAPYGPPADVWSLGVVVAEAVAGIFPFALDTSMRKQISPGCARQSCITDADMALVELYEAVCSEHPPRLDARSCGPELADFVAACLQHDPGARASTADLLRHPLVAGAPAHRDVFCAWARSVAPFPDLID